MSNPMANLLHRQNNNMMTMLQGMSNPDALFRQMMQSNPQFAQFVNDNKGKTPEQIAQEHGINVNQIMSLLRGCRP